MTKKRTGEYKTQYKITRRLNRIVTTDDRNKQKELKKELYELTHDFWYRKFTEIRNILQGNASDETKCNKIQQVIDMPKDGLSNLLRP